MNGVDVTARKEELIMDNKTNETIIKMLKGVIISGLLSFGLYILSFIPINLFIYHEDYVSERDFTPIYFIMMMLYIIANYIVYIRKSTAESGVGKSESAFDIKADLLSYISGEGKYLFIIYGVLAVVFEMFYMIIGRSPITAALLFFFPLSAVIPVPVIRTVVSYVVLMSLLMAATEFARYRKFKYWHMN